MVPMSLREEYMEVQSREAPMTPAAPPPPLPGNSSQGLQKSAADALRRFGLGGFPPNQPNQGNANRGNWMGGQGGGGMMPNQGPKFGGLQAAASQSLQAIQQQQQQQQMQQAQAGGMGPGMMRRRGPRSDGLHAKLWSRRVLVECAPKRSLDRWALLEEHRPSVEALRGDAQEQGLEASDQDPFDYIGFDQHGRPVLLERVGAWRVDVVLRATEDLEEFKVLHAMANEILRQMKRPEGIQDPRGFILIIDLNGLSMAHLRPRLAFVFGELKRGPPSRMWLRQEGRPTIKKLSSQATGLLMATFLKRALRRVLHLQLATRRPDGMMGGYGGPPGPPGGPMAAQARRPMDAMRARPPDMGNQGQMPMPPQPQGMQAPRPPGPPTAMRPEESSRCAQQMNLNNMNLRRERDDMPKAPFPMPKQSMPMPPPPPKPMPAKPTEMNTTSAPEGRPGQIWVVVKSPHFSHVIVRLSQEVTSRELRRALPGELVTQRGMTETLPNGLVRMPVEPDGWVTVHARNINGPTFLAEAQPDANQARPNRGAREGVPPPPERKVPDFYRPDEDADRPSNAVGVYAKEVLLAVRERIRESNPQAPEEMHGLRSIVVPNLGDRKAGHRKHRERDRVAEAEEWLMWLIERSNAKPPPCKKQLIVVEALAGN
eukprot:g8493.t2